MINKKILFISIAFLLPTHVYAYIDPGSGSAITAAILAFLSGIFFYFKKIFYKTKEILKKVLRINKNNTDNK